MEQKFLRERHEMNITVPEKAELLIDSSTGDNFLSYVYDKAINAGSGLSKIVKTTSFFQRLVDAYKEPVATSGDKIIHRKYHDFNHIAEGVRDLSNIEPDCECASLDDVLLAWFYHDAYYKIGTDLDNERASADYVLMDLIQMGWKAERAGRLFDLVMWTKHDKNPPADDYEANLIVDIDLLRIAAEPIEAFFLATEMVREEFALYDDKAWADGRIKFWKGFLERKKGRIFRTSHFEHFNRVAIDNINKEMFSLEKANFVKR